MATLSAIGFTTVGGLGVTVVSFFLFGIAVRSRSTNIAPRCTARSRDVIYNPMAKKPETNRLCCWWKKKRGFREGEEMEEGTPRLEGVNVPEHVQYRGAAMTGWIPWTLSLSYNTLLRGIPGTGTRKNGLEGALLKVNLDGIILLRFHSLALRVSTLATILTIGLLLPLNLTARCENSDYEGCKADFNMTDFELTTIHSIPPLSVPKSESNNSLFAGVFGANFSIFGSNYSNYLGRLYAVVFVSWVISWYALILLSKEWVEVLALRRVFYLENSHFENRTAELEETLQYVEEDEIEDDLKPGALNKRRRMNKPKSKKKLSLLEIQKKKREKAESERMKRRDPWIPHPEQRETVPNIELYSILVGNIPSKPSEVTEEEDDLEGALGVSKNDLLHWQLTVATAFFDQCVPNQPGFSSSVAAVTILPDAPKLALAWRTWYRHVGLLRRLRFIRGVISDMRHYEINDDDGSECDGKSATSRSEDQSGMEKIPSEQARSILNLEEELLGPHTSDDPLDDEEMQEEMGNTEIWKRMNYIYNVFGTDYEEDVVSLLVQAMNYGPEQTAVFSREFAQGAASCCPNGCGEERTREKRIDELVELEKEIKAKVEESFKDLIKAQNGNVDFGDDDGHTVIHNGPGENAQSQNAMEEGTRTPTIAHDVPPPPLPPPDDLTKDPGTPNLSNRAERAFDRVTSRDITVVGGNSRQEKPLLPPSGDVSMSGFTASTRRHKTVNLTTEGKVYQSDFSAVDSINGGVGKVDQSTWLQSGPSWEGKNTSSSSLPHGPPPTIHPDFLDENANVHIQMPNQIPSHAMSSRRRLNTGNSQINMSLSLMEGSGRDHWSVYEGIVKNNDKDRVVDTGEWKKPKSSDFGAMLSEFGQNIKNWASRKTKDVVDDLATDATFAVVTFTSRQAAVAARHCLADGRGENKWTPVKEIPVPPLADAAVCDFKTCRGCCRPVTLTVAPKQQLIRRYVALIILALLYVFSTFVITSASTLVAPEKLYLIWPELEQYTSDSVFLNNLLSGVLPAFFFSLFFALCPIMFRAIANFGSNAVSVNEAEFAALRYYWWFMLVTAFSGTSLATMTLNALNARQEEDYSFTSVLKGIAGTLPTQVSATWLNWIIFRTFVTLPLQYMLQMNSYVFEWLGWKCCRRCVMGGGPGGPIPYRIYIDSGVVFLCTVALSPVCPLVAPAAVCYFLYCTPLWRRNCIFIYRPKFDTGGIRWPFLADIYLTSIIVAQILLTTVMGLKEALGPAILAAFPIIPTLIHRREKRRRYLKSYEDAALLQTSQLDGWDNSASTSIEQRENYRKFLVDAHKAAYVPICIAGGKSAALTAEPAVVFPHEGDAMLSPPVDELSIASNAAFNNVSLQDLYKPDRPPSPMTQATAGTPLFLNRANNQFGATFRRMPATVIDGTDDGGLSRARTFSHGQPTPRPPPHPQQYPSSVQGDQRKLR